MNKEKIGLGIVLFLLGAIGILSILTMDIPLPEEVAEILSKRFTPMQIKQLTLINPSILLFGAVLLGVLFYDKVSLDVPIIRGLVLNKHHYSLVSILKYGIMGGLLAGVLITLIALIYKPLLPEEFIELGESLKPSLAARFLYGGITEEILLRFGLMTFLIFIFHKISKKLSHPIYWAGIVVSAIVFAIGHFPIAFQSVESPSATLLSYILIGNTVGGLIFGYLYWKKGLEAAFIAHACAHVMLVLGEMG